MEFPKYDAIKKILKKYKFTVAATIAALCLLIIVIANPKTVASGNGYKHQVGDFGECEFDLEGCTKDATHRLHYLFSNEDYCDSCWDRYGENMFVRLSENDDSGLNYSQNRCRHSGCGKTAKYSEWDRRYCAEHLQGNKYCRYPGCSKLIPINSWDDYCDEH